MPGLTARGNSCEAPSAVCGNGSPTPNPRPPASERRKGKQDEKARLCSLARALAWRSAWQATKDMGNLADKEDERGNRRRAMKPNLGPGQRVMRWPCVACLGLLLSPLSAQEPKLRDTLKEHK